MQKSPAAEENWKKVSDRFCQKVVQTTKALRDLVIEERLERKRTEEDAVLDYLRHQSDTVSDLQRSSNAGSNTSDQSFISVSGRTSDQGSSHSSMKNSSFTPRHCIGLNEWQCLTNMLNLTEPEIVLLHSVFIVKQKNGLLSARRFWQIFRYLHLASDASDGSKIDESIVSEFKYTMVSSRHVRSPTCSHANKPSIDFSTQNLSDTSLTNDASQSDKEILLGLMNERSLIGKLFFRSLDIYGIKALNFFEFALVCPLLFFILTFRVLALYATNVHVYHLAKWYSMYSM